MSSDTPDTLLYVRIGQSKAIHSKCSGYVGTSWSNALMMKFTPADGNPSFEMDVLLQHRSRDGAAVGF